MGLTIAWKIFVAFCLVLFVVLGLGIWSLEATRRLNDLNEALLTQAIPAVRLQLELSGQISALARHETRAIVLKDSAYQALHREQSQEFRRRLHNLSGLLRGREARETLDQLRARFAEYSGLVEQEWMALRQGAVEQAFALSDGPARRALDVLDASIAALLAQSRVDVERQVGAASGLEHSARAATVVSLAVSLAVGLGLATLVAVRITRPIRELRRATQLVARGEYNLPMLVKSRDEVGDLARSFRDMAQKLREMDTLKGEFFSNISHDFRSPLTSIQMATRLLRADPLSPKQERWVEVIRTDSEKLLRLTNQILDLSKLRSGMLHLKLVETDLRRVAESATLELRPLADEKGVTLLVAVPDPPPAIVCDEDRIQQVLTNLLSNAVKFTSRGGEVRLTCREEETEAIFLVEDSGIGIPAAELPYIFERYHQAHLERGGTGLGLAIVRGFTEAHGGRVWAESQEGEGSRFYVALPRNGGRA